MPKTPISYSLCWSTIQTDRRMVDVQLDRYHRGVCLGEFCLYFENARRTEIEQKIRTEFIKIIFFVNKAEGALFLLVRYFLVWVE